MLPRLLCFYCWFFEADLCLRKLSLCLSSANTLHCICLLPEATFKFAVFWFIAMLIWRRRTSSNCCRAYFYCWFYEADLCLRKLSLCLSSVNALHCICLLEKATLKFVVFLFIAMLILRRRISGNCCRAYYGFIVVLMKRNSVCASLFFAFYDSFFSQWAPLHLSAADGHFEVCRLLLECSADVEAKNNG